MLVQTEKTAVGNAGLVQFGAGITPKLIHWFLPSGYLGSRFAARVAALTEAFYQIKGNLQTLYDEANDADCMLSDHAILDYMYRFYVSPTCAGDTAEMLAQMQRIVLTGMRRLLMQRASQRAQRHSDADPVTRALYADALMQEEMPSEFEQEYDREDYDYTYRECMRSDMFGNYAEDYDEETAFRTRGTYAEELEEALRRNPALLLPSAAVEAEWDSRAEAWEEADAAAERGMP